MLTDFLEFRGSAFFRVPMVHHGASSGLTVSRNGESQLSQRAACAKIYSVIKFF
jgi:hypothetical protein